MLKFFRILSFTIVWGSLSTLGYIAVDLEKSTLIQVVQVVNIFIIYILLVSSISEVDEDIGANSIIVGIIFIPIALLGVEIKSKIIPDQFNSYLLIANVLVIWIFLSLKTVIRIDESDSATLEKDKSNLKERYPIPVILLTCLWLTIVLLKAVGDSIFFSFSIETLNRLQAIHYLISIRTFIICIGVILCMIDVISNFGGEPKPNITNFSKINTSEKNMHEIVIPIVHIFNIIWGVLNALWVSIATILIYFFWIIPRLIVKFLMRFIHLNLFILPYLLSVLIFFALIYLTKQHSLTIVEYVLTETREESLSFILDLIKYTGTAVVLIIVFVSTGFNYRKKEFDFNSLLPFPLTYLLFILITVGWMVWFMRIQNISHYEIGYITIWGTVFILSGTVLYIIYQVFSSKKPSA